MDRSRPSLRLDIPNARRLRGAAALLLGAGLAVSLVGPAAAQSPAAGEPLEIVVTTSILGAVVSDLVGDRADVQVLMSNGVDPHDWSPSAQDIEAVYGADLVVENGLGLEESLHDALEEAAANGVTVFAATDVIELRAVTEGDPADEHHDEEEHTDAEGSHAPGEEDHDHGVWDPHFWTDPVAMRTVVDALGPVIGGLGVDVSDRQTELGLRLDALDREVETIVATIPEDRRKLVTGHESMGYFADQYDLQLIGAVIPGLSSQGEVSARELAAISQKIRDEGVTVIFTEIGTPQSVVDAIAGETGVAVVALPSHNLPEDGSYETFIRDIANAVASALSA
jgi:zinc/manganese transport system substrate-binding protein